MKSIIRLRNSPEVPNFEIFDEIIINLFVPYSENSLTIKINPYVTDYKENLNQPGIKVRHLSVMTDTEDTVTLSLDFDNNIQNFDVAGQQYQIQLLDIGKERFDNQDFPYFELLVRSL